MKNILKIVFWLIVGAAAGYYIGLGLGALLTGESFSESLRAHSEITVYEGLLVVLNAVCAFIIGILVLIPIHEAGHLVAGLATGYKFVSFRIFNLTFIKIDGRIRVKRFGVEGTGGQCLLSPPDLPLEKIPTVWYNAGGVLANILIGLLLLPILFLSKNPFVIEFVAVFLLTDLLLILVNGIPMKLNGLGNDAYNMLNLHKDLKSMRGMVLQLQSNALIQKGVRPREMPKEWFEPEAEINWKNPLEVSIPLAHASLLLDLLDIDNAKKEFEELYSHRDDIIGLYNYEIACELAFCALATGDRALAEELLTPKTIKYITTYARVMSGKQRLLFAMALYLDHDDKKSHEIYSRLEKDKDRYLLQGEVKSDLAIMKHLIQKTEK